MHQLSINTQKLGSQFCKPECICDIFNESVTRTRFPLIALSWLNDTLLSCKLPIAYTFLSQLHSSPKDSSPIQLDGMKDCFLPPEETVYVQGLYKLYSRRTHETQSFLNFSPKNAHTYVRRRKKKRKRNACYSKLPIPLSSQKRSEGCVSFSSKLENQTTLKVELFSNKLAKI